MSSITSNFNSTIIVIINKTTKIIIIVAMVVIMCQLIKDTFSKMYWKVHPNWMFNIDSVKC